MGEHEENWGGSHPSGGVMLNGLVPEGTASVMRALDSERWAKAEERTAELIACIQPNPSSEERRSAVADYVKRLITECFPCKVFTFGSVPLKTYLPDGDIDLTAFSRNKSLKETWAHQVRDILENEEKNENAEFRVKEVQYIQAEVKLIKCLVENIVVDISFNQLGGLCTLCFLEEVDFRIKHNHLFKRSIILIKAWCYYESRILGAHHGLISTYALETLVLYIFHVFNNSFTGPLEVLYRFLEFFSKFDWENFCVSLDGPVLITSLPAVSVKPPREDGGDLLLTKQFLNACSSVYAVFPIGQDNQGQPFVSKHFNVIDPLRVNNNLGRSVSKGNFFRIRSAFAFGAKRLARLLECPKEDLCFEVNQFFMNTWDRHGKGQRPDAPRNDLSCFTSSSSNHDLLLHGRENIKNDTTSSKKKQARDDDDEDEGLGGLENALKTSDASALAHIQTQKSSKSMDHVKKENNNHGAQPGNAKKSSKPENSVGEIQGRFLFSRTRLSPKLSDAYDEVSSHGKHDNGKNQDLSVMMDNTGKKNQETGIRPTDDPSSVRRVLSRQSLEGAVESRIGSNSYQYETGSRVVNEDFSSVSGAQGMHQEEQDLVNMMASSAHGFNGPVHVPLDLVSHHLPLPISPSVLASMGYTQRNMGEMLPSNIPMIENPWGQNMRFPQGFVPSYMPQYFPGMGSSPGPENHLEHTNENSVEADHDLWQEPDRHSTGGHEVENEGFEILRTDDKQQLTSSGYTAGSSMRGQHKYPKDTTRGSAREDQLDDLHYQDNRGNEGYFDDRPASSRSVSASRTGSIRSKTSSESSWEGSSVKALKSTREKRGRRTSPFSVPSVASHGKHKSVSEHSSTQADDDNRDWNVSSPIGAPEVSDRSTVSHPSSWQVSRHHPLSGFEPAQTSGSDSVIPLVVNPHSRQRAGDAPRARPFTFYATGPPVPFVTMLPVYNFPSETGNSDPSTSHFSVEEIDNSDSGQNFNTAEGLDQPISNTLDSTRRETSLELTEHKPDILDGDFDSYWQNLRYGRFCQDAPHPTPMMYQQSSPVMVPPGYFQGPIPVEGPGRPMPNNMNLITQVMSYRPQVVPVSPLQTLPNRPAGIYQQYVEDMPRYRSGTGTYLPNPKVSTRERHSSGNNNRRGSYSFDRNDHHGDREGNWNVNPKSRPSGRGYSRSHSEKSNTRPDRLTGSDSRSERSWSSHRHDSFTAYQSQNGPTRSSSAQNSGTNTTNAPYGTYPLPSMSHSGVVSSSNGPNMPSIVMFYPYDNSGGYRTHPSDLPEFGSLGFPSSTEVPQPIEGGQMSGAIEDQRFHGSVAQQSPDQPSSPQNTQR